MVGLDQCFQTRGACPLWGFNTSFNGSKWKVVLTRISNVRYFGGGRFRSAVPNLGCLSPVGVQNIVPWE